MFNKLRDKVHASNVEAGWWSDLRTGESILSTRNRPELLCLITSELCEAAVDGYKPDSHLPQFPALHVEVADTAIRILDLAGADQIDLETGDPYRIIFHGDMLKDLMNLVILISSYALEGVRKRNTELYHQSIADAYQCLFKFADLYEFDLDECIQAKCDYNSNREDHKVENRRAPGGKQI
jgi:hypothetical protein